ncbi:MAG: hypothetical protein WA210_07790 [Burkholderiaceae bacterium]
MWILVRVVKGSKYFEAETKVENHVLVCDSSDLVISARSTGDGAYRFEARKGTENFIVAEFTGAQAAGPLTAQFFDLAAKLGAVSVAAAPAR